MEGDFELLDESVATVWAVRLRDGRRVVAKLQAAIAGERFLLAVQAVQRRVADAGFPAPRPLAAPERVGDRFLTLETLLEHGATPDGHDPATRAQMAAGLAVLSELSTPLASLPGLAENPWRENPRGDGPLVVGHTDWRVQNMRFDGGRLSAVYDWESLDVLSEAELVGGVSAAFTADWTHGPGVFPSPQESAAFVLAYERARGRRFSADEHRRVTAAAARRAAYVRTHASARRGP